MEQLHAGPLEWAALQPINCQTNHMQDCVSPRIATLAQHDKLNDSRILCTGDAHGNYVIRSNGTLCVQSVHLRKSATRTTKIKRMRSDSTRPVRYVVDVHVMKYSQSIEWVVHGTAKHVQYCLGLGSPHLRNMIS